jgi:hypothetical protein
VKELLRGQLWQGSAAEVEILTKPEAMGAYARYGWRGVVTVSRESRPQVVGALAQLCLPVEELTPTPFTYFTLACRFAREFAPLVVHCHAGANRSRVFAAAIVFRVWQVPLEEAIRLADPPPGRVMDSLILWATKPEDLR